MDFISDYWRTEALHPLFVHFPIALLLVAMLFKFFSFWEKGKFLDKPGTILLITGIIGGWLAIYTGELADGIVSRTLCDPTVLKDHQNNSYTMIWLFTIAAIVDLIYQLRFLFLPALLVKWLVIILLFVGSGFLVYTGHLGAKLVYEQAAGVYRPSLDCAEFN